MKTKEIFLDAASNTPLDKEVIKAMKPYLNPKFVGNSHSAHGFGARASRAIEESRHSVGRNLCVPAESVFFTSGASESNNIVIKGLALAELQKPIEEQKRHIICGATEHDSVIRPCQQLEKLGFEVTYLLPNDKGVIELSSVQLAVRSDTLLVCLMLANNETGAKNPLDAISCYLKLECDHKVQILADCTQALGYGGKTTFLGINYPHVDYFTFSGHKIYGPTGTGVLVARPSCIPTLRQFPLVASGAQEQGIRGGTSNTAGIVGLATALDLMSSNDYEEHYRYLMEYLKAQYLTTFKNYIKTNGYNDFDNIININLYKELGEARLYEGSLANEFALRGVAVSAGSACDAEHDEDNGDFNPSHVLKSMNIPDVDIRNSIRVSFNKHTTTKDIDRLIQAMVDIKQDLTERRKIKNEKI